MSSWNVEQTALRLLKTFENAGQPVSRIVVVGKRIELVLSEKVDADEFDRIDMRHGQA